MSETRDLDAVARSLATADNLPGALALLNANGLSLHEAFEVHGIVLANRVLRAPMTEYDDARVFFAGLIRPTTETSPA